MNTHASNLEVHRMVVKTSGQPFVYRVTTAKRKTKERKKDKNFFLKGYHHVTPAAAQPKTETPAGAGFKATWRRN